MDYGKRVSELLIQNNMNANELAIACDVTPSTIYSLVKRKSQKMNVNLAMKIAHSFHMTLDEFVGESEAMTQYLSPFDHRLVTAYHAATPKEQGIVCITLGIQPEEGALSTAFRMEA